MSTYPPKVTLPVAIDHTLDEEQAQALDAIVRELGDNPSGDELTVEARIAGLEAQLAKPAPPAQAETVPVDSIVKAATEAAVSAAQTAVDGAVKRSGDESADLIRTVRAEIRSELADTIEKALVKRDQVIDDRIKAAVDDVTRRLENLAADVAARS